MRERRVLGRHSVTRDVSGLFCFESGRVFVRHDVTEGESDNQLESVNISDTHRPCPTRSRLVRRGAAPRRVMSLYLTTAEALEMEIDSSVLADYDNVIFAVAPSHCE